MNVHLANEWTPGAPEYLERTTKIHGPTRRPFTSQRYVIVTETTLKVWGFTDQLGCC